MPLHRNRLSTTTLSFFTSPVLGANLTACKPLQCRQISVERIRITSIGVAVNRISVESVDRRYMDVLIVGLPDGLVRPASGNSANRAAVACQNQGTSAAELARITRALSLV